MEVSARLARLLAAAAILPLVRLSYYIQRVFLAEYIYVVADGVKKLLDRVDRPMLRQYFVTHLPDFERCHSALCSTAEVLEGMQAGALPSGARKQLRRAIRDLDELIARSREFRDEGIIGAIPWTAQGGGGEVLSKGWATRVVDVFRSYLVSFWVGLVVYLFVLVAGLAVVILRVLSRSPLNTFTALVIGMVIGTVAILVDIFRDLRYWRVADAD